MAFELHPSLAAECLLIKELGVCNLYLRNIRHFPWLLLIPARDGLREIFDLPREEYLQAMDEVRRVTQAFAEITGADKMNVATLGNICPQLHIHIIARFKTDAGWPNPVWNVNLPVVAYEKQEADKLIQKILSSPPCAGI
jgi:diadenosine tetraphosphate (Ap4A) HIT family hydrolase